MKKFIALFVFLFIGTRFIQAQTNTWADNIATIFYDNCSTCHHEGGIGPFAIMTYQDALDKAIEIQTQVNAKKMPPWQPDPNYVHFQHERTLEQGEIDMISDWIDDGAPSGNLANAPTPPVFTNGSQMQAIDETLHLPSWTVTTDVDQYRSFVVQTNNSTDLFLNQIEYVPSNGSIVHHIVIWMDPTNVSLNRDNLDPLPGFESNGATPPSFASRFVGAWTPGSSIFKLPINMGIRVPSGGDFVVELHYAPGSINETDSTTVNLKYTSYPNIREVYNEAILEHFDGLTDGPLFVPANTIQTFHEAFDVDGFDVSLVATFPHMHLIGTSIKSWALDANGDTTRLISIPHWDFHWQGYYNYQQMIPIHDGSTLWAEAVYDNTSNNELNPNDPPLDISAGEQTTDEMMIVFYAYTFYEPGDEDVILDSTLISTNDISGNVANIDVFPNPATDETWIGLNLKSSSAATVELFNAAGMLMRKDEYTNLNAGFSTLPLSMKDYVAGMYLVKVSTNDGLGVKKLLKQ